MHQICAVPDKNLPSLEGCKAGDHLGKAEDQHEFAEICGTQCLRGNGKVNEAENSRHRFRQKKPSARPQYATPTPLFLLCHEANVPRQAGLVYFIP
jgi:hypothetical protein